jgi:hypothetical protein
MINSSDTSTCNSIIGQQDDNYRLIGFALQSDSNCRILSLDAISEGVLPRLLDILGSAPCSSIT